MDRSGSGRVAHARMMGLAEHWFGAGRGSGYMIMVLIGSGVGACIITDGITARGSALRCSYGRVAI
jgi:predicted NBD/HSP70 family sugar kinase